MDVKLMTTVDNKKFSNYLVQLSLKRSFIAT